MATQFFMRDAAATISRGTNSNNGAASAVWWRAKLLSTTAGTGGVYDSVATVASSTNVLEIKDGDGVTLEWISPPLAAGVTISGTVDCELFIHESNMSANAGAVFQFYKLAATDLTLTQICSIADSGEMLNDTPVSNNSESFSGTPTSTALAKGDRLLVRIGCRNVGTMAGGYQVNFQYDGGSASDYYSWVRVNENLTFQTSDPSTQTLRLTETASSVSTADVDYKIWTSTS